MHRILDISGYYMIYSNWMYAPTVGFIWLRLLVGHAVLVRKHCKLKSKYIIETSWEKNRSMAR